MKEKAKSNWKKFEDLIFDIYTELEPHAEVKWNDFIEGIESGVKRQIDISIKTSVGGHKILIIVQAKNLKKRADINVLGEFNSVIHDVRASKGILICNAGFTTTAKEYAKKRKIDICTAHDASQKEWAGEIKIPVIKTSVSVNLTIKHSFIPTQPTTISGVHMPIPEEAIREFLKKWENDELNKTVGKHILELDSDIIKPTNSYLALQSSIEYTISHRHHFKFFKPVDYRGIKDYITENFTPSFVEFNEPIPFLNDGTWEFIPSIQDVNLSTSHLKIEILDFDMLRNKRIRFDWNS